MKKILMFSGFWILATQVLYPAYCTAESVIRVNRQDKSVTVETERYRVVVKNGSLMTVENRLAGELFTQEVSPDKDKRNIHNHFSGLFADAKKRVKRWPDDQSSFSVKEQSGKSVTVEYQNLAGIAGRAQNDTFIMILSLDDASGDLLVNLSCTTENPGITEVVFTIPFLKKEVACLSSIFWGNRLTYEDFKDSHGTWQWPGFHWKLQMAIMEGVKGTAMVWSEDSAVMQPKSFHWNCYAGVPGIGFGSENTKTPVEKATSLETVTWRFNVFGKDWREPANRFKDFLNSAYRMEEIKVSRPQWIRELQLFCRMDSMENIFGNTGFNLSHSVFMQWGPGWYTPSSLMTQWAGRMGEADYPPAKYRILPDGKQPDMLERIQAVHRLGARTCAATQFNWFGKQHYLWSRPENAGIMIDRPWSFLGHLGSPRIRNYIVEQLDDMFSAVPLDGAYMDTAGITLPEWGEIDGINYNKGLNLFYTELRRAPHVKDKLIFSEVLNEANLHGTDLALLVNEAWGTENDKIQRRLGVHPLGAYLTSDYVKITTHGSAFLKPDTRLRWHREHDFGEVIGQIPSLYLWGEQITDPRHEERVLMEKAQYFTQKNLRRIFPEKIDPNVAAYYLGNNGKEYRYIKDRGRAFVEMEGPDSRTIYHRIHGVTEFAGRGRIENWVCYKDNLIIGLDPENYYCYFDEKRTNPVNVSALPAGWTVQSVRETASYLSVSFKGTAESTREGTLEVTPVISGGRMYAGGVPVNGADKEGQKAMVNMNIDDSLVFIKPGEHPAIEKRSMDKTAVLHMLTDAGFTINRSDFPLVPASRKIEGSVRSGLKIAGNPAYLDWCGQLKSDSIKVTVFPLEKSGENKRTGRQEKLVVSLNGKILATFEHPGDEPAVREVEIPAVDAAQPELLTVFWTGRNVELYITVQ